MIVFTVIFFVLIAFYILSWFLLLVGSLGGSPSESEMRMGDIGEFMLRRVLSKPLSLIYKELPFFLEITSNELQLWKPIVFIPLNASIQAFGILYLWNYFTT
jgi:hypothetical protein